VDHAPTTICVISSTNKGDVYVHPLLESISEETLSKDSDSLPLGGASVVVPHEKTGQAQGFHSDTLFNSLRMNLTNEYPIPSSAIVAPLKQKQQSERNMGEPWEARFPMQWDPVEVRPSGAQSVALSIGAGQSVHLESNLLVAQKQIFHRTLDSFNDDLFQLQREQIRQNKHNDRTDLTSEAIEDAELDWAKGLASEKFAEEDF